MKSKSLKPPTDQKLADDMARMMGWKLVGTGHDSSDYWARGRADRTGYQYERYRWQPHLDYNQCRIVEDWLWDHQAYARYLNVLERVCGCSLVSRSTPLQRCQAAWLAWKEAK